MRLQCSEKGEVLSPYNHVEQPPQSSYDMHSSYRAGDRTKPQHVINDFVDRVEKRSSIFMPCTVHKVLVTELNLKHVTNDFMDRVERRSTIFDHFST